MIDWQLQDKYGFANCEHDKKGEIDVGRTVCLKTQEGGSGVGALGSREGSLRIVLKVRADSSCCSSTTSDLQNQILPQLLQTQKASDKIGKHQ